MKLRFAFLFFLMATICFAQQSVSVDFKHAQVSVFPNAHSATIDAQATYTFKVKKQVDSVYLDAKNMGFQTVLLDHGEVAYSNDSKHLIIKKQFKAGDTHTLFVHYQTQPKKAFYFVQKDGHVQIWTQGQGKYTSNWLPSLDDTNDKIEFDLSITFNRNFQVVSNGKLVSKQINDSTATWHYNMIEPMSSYLVALVIGKYSKKTEDSKNGIPLEMYYYPKDTAKVEPTYRYTKRMFDFLEEEIDVPFPWQNYKQVPVHDFLYAGMENTSCTIFSEAYMVNDTAFVDKNYVNVNAHELAHQWFGDMVTAKSGEHHWLQEGFATYYALLAERNVFGDQYYYWRLYEYAQELLQQNTAKQSTSLLNPKSSSLTFYKRGCWVLYALRETVGDAAFKLAVKTYLEKHQFGTVDTHDFISEVENTSGMDLSEFVSTWIKNKTFPYDSAHQLLMKIPFIQEYEMVDCEVANSKCREYLDSYISDNAKIKIIQQDPSLINVKTFDTSLKVRQAIAQSLTKIPLELKEKYETLLNDPSYITIEAALFNLWNTFPEDRTKYLNKTQNIIGFNDKNVRMLWLVLALSTPDYKPEQSQAFYNELVGYTVPDEGFETRLKAFEYLLMTHSCKVACQENLKAATKHHNWRLAKFAKNQLKHINPNQE